VFTVFGDPAGFSFTATGAGLTQPLQLGEAAKGPLTLQVKAPALPVQMRGAPFTAVQAQSATLVVKLLRTDGSSTSTVATASTLGATITQQVSLPGAYHMELWITPKHLTTALGSSAQAPDHGAGLLRRAGQHVLPVGHHQPDPRHALTRPAKIDRTRSSSAPTRNGFCRKPARPLPTKRLVTSTSL